jgi:Histidine kinase-, DNA gyrase B-, and HSP90-like ATPase
MPKIRVHERALAHLSRGLYRSPASALRELVSNAWDANATVVTIDTNHPNFFQLSIEDNGDGFSRDEFESLMRGGIGNSSKRTAPRAQEYGRPTIGRLGIGMLGIAQICGAFTVTSRPASGKGFRARVVLYDLAKQKMDEPNSALLKDAETDLNGEKIQGKIAEVGTYDFEEFDSSKLQCGTRILADDVIPTFTQAFQDSLNLPGFKPVPLEWRPAVTKVLKNAISLQLLGDYWRLLWELAAACPLPYLADDALPRGAVKDLNQLLSSYNFALIVDGRKLYKPVYLKANPGGYTTKVVPRTTLKIYGNSLTFSGYICVQEGLQLKPDELRGIMVRIKNIGVGYYDPSMLDYRVNQGPRSRWVTGEIFVEEGLEDSLNIDRDSFNRFHPEFRALQIAVHEILEKDIFPEVYKNIKIRSDSRRANVASGRDEAIRDVLKSGETRRVKVLRRATGKDTDGPISSAHRSKDEVEIVVPKVDDIPTPKPTQQLAQAILTIFELAMLAGDRDAQRSKFSELLIDLLKRW